MKILKIFELILPIYRKVIDENFLSFKYEECYKYIYDYFQSFFKDENTNNIENKLLKYTDSIIEYIGAIINRYYLQPKVLLLQQSISNFNNNNISIPNKNSQESTKSILFQYKNNLLREWNFYKRSLDSSGVKVVAAAIKFNYSLEKLLIRSCQIEDNDLEIILNGLRFNARNNSNPGNINLCGINKIGNRYSHNNFEPANEDLQDNKTHQFSMIPIYSHINELDLMYNNISNKGCEILGDFMSTNSTIKYLNIGMNSLIEYDGIKSLINGITINNTLIQLQLQGLKINDNCSSIFKELFEHNKGLKVIEIPNNMITHISIKEWQTVLEENDGLVELNFSANKLQDIGGFILADILTKNLNIEIIDMKHTEQSSDSYNKLVEVFNNNSNIKVIDLRANLDIKKGDVEILMR